MSIKLLPRHLATAVVFLLAGASSAQTGRIVFSTSPIDLSNPQNLTTAFKAGDPIYSAAMLTAPPKALCQGRVSNMATKEFAELKLTVDDYRESGPVMDGAMIWSRDLGSLAGGTHKVKIKVTMCYVVAAAGEFAIQGAAFDYYAQLVPKLKDEQTKQAVMSPPNMRDHAVENSIPAAIKASPSQAWKDQILRTSIIDSDWYIERHGKCSFYRLCTFKQNYIGGKFGPTFSDGRGDRIPIACENVSR